MNEATDRTDCCGAWPNWTLAAGHKLKEHPVGLCTLNQVDPLPITYNLPNP
jgi:hypothetical protein